MKTLIYSFFFALLFLSSCSKDDSSVVSPYEKVNPSENVVERGIITPSTLLPFMTKYDLARKSAGNANARESRTNTTYGPFTVNGNLRVVYPNRKTVLTTNQSVYPPGVYFCDIYICDYTFTLPAGAFFSLQAASKFGYDNFSTQNVAVTYTQSLTPSGNSYTIYTYSIVPLYNEAGQFIYNGTIPTDLTGTTFTYSYQI